MTQKSLPPVRHFYLGEKGAHWLTLKFMVLIRRGKQEVDLSTPPSQLVVLQLCQAPGGKSAQFAQNT